MVASSIIKPIIQPLDRRRYRQQLLMMEKVDGVDSYLSSLYYALTDQSHRGHVATLKGQPIGYVLYNWLGREVVVPTVTVAGSCRRRRVGMQLVWKIMEEELRPAYPTLRTWVRHTNKVARLFCLGIGLQACGQQPNYFRDGESADIFAYHLPAIAGFTHSSRFSVAAPPFWL